MYLPRSRICLCQKKKGKSTNAEPSFVYELYPQISHINPLAFYPGQHRAHVFDLSQLLEVRTFFFKDFWPKAFNKESSLFVYWVKEDEERRETGSKSPEPRRKPRPLRLEQCIWPQPDPLDYSSISLKCLQSKDYKYFE